MTRIGVNYLVIFYLIMGADQLPEQIDNNDMYCCVQQLHQYSKRSDETFGKLRKKQLKLFITDSVYPPDN